MSPHDFIRSETKKLGEAKGLSSLVAEQVAEKVVSDFSKNTYRGKPFDLIQDSVALAVKTAKKKKQVN